MSIYSTHYRQHPHQLRAESQPRTFTLSAFPCSSDSARSQDRKQGPKPWTQESCYTPPSPASPQAWPSRKVTCRDSSGGDAKAELKALLKRETPQPMALEGAAWCLVPACQESARGGTDPRPCEGTASSLPRRCVLEERGRDGGGLSQSPSPRHTRAKI